MPNSNNVVLNKNLGNNNWLGIVINNVDPDFAGRCKVKVFSLMDDIPDEYIPWFVPMTGSIFSNSGAGNISIPKIGTLVRVTFSGSDIYSGEYTAIQNIDSELIEEIKNDYQGTHVLLYDSSQEILVIFQPNSGFKIYYRESYIQITPDNMITLQHSNNQSVIQLIGDKITISSESQIDVAAKTVNINAEIANVEGSQFTTIGEGDKAYHAINGEQLMSLIGILAKNIDAKTPASPGMNSSLVSSMKPGILNSKVIIKQ